MGLIQLAIINFGCNDIANQFIYSVKTRFIQAAGRRFNRICQAKQAHFFRLRFWAGVSIGALLHRRKGTILHLHDFKTLQRVGLLLKGSLVEIVNEGIAVMLLNAIYNR